MKLKPPRPLDEIAADIVRAREARGMTQAELRRAIGAQTNTMYRIERGQQLPGPEFLVRIGLVLGLSPAELLFGRDAVPDAHPQADASPGGDWDRFTATPEYQAADEWRQERLKAMALDLEASGRMPTLATLRGLLIALYSMDE